MAVAVQLIARFGRFGPQGKFDGEVLAEWLYRRIAQPSRSTRDEQRKLFSQLMVHVIGTCSKQTVRQVMLTILAKHTTFSSKVEQFEMIVANVRHAGGQLRDVGTTLVADLQGYFVDAHGRRKAVCSCQRPHQGSRFAEQRRPQPFRADRRRNFRWTPRSPFDGIHHKLFRERPGEIWWMTWLQPDTRN